MIWLVAALVGVVILQTNVTPAMAIGRVRPDLFLLLLYFSSYRMSPARACLWGGLLGLYEDALSGAPMGLHALTLSVVGYMLVRAREELEEARLVPHVGLLFLTGVASGFMVLAILAFFGMGRGFTESVFWIVLPGAGYTTAVGGILLFSKRLRHLVEVRL